MQHLDDGSSLSDEVFEESETGQNRRLTENVAAKKNTFSVVEHPLSYEPKDLYTNINLNTTIPQTSNFFQVKNLRSHRLPSSSYRSARDISHAYALDDLEQEESSFETGWKSYRYDEDNIYPPPPVQPFDDTVNHKTILLGDSGVGKTSFLVKYNTGDFRHGSFSATVGIALTNKVVLIDGTKVKLQIWDTAGQERFKSVTHAYYRDAHALLLLYDITHRTTFDNIRAWLAEISEYAQENVAVILLGNKADCNFSERQVRKEDGERLGEEYGVPFMETSAKTGLNVELAFTAIARQLKSRGNNNGRDGRFNVHEFVRDNSKSRSMCAQCRNM